MDLAHRLTRSLALGQLNWSQLDRLQNLLAEVEAAQNNDFHHERDLAHREHVVPVLAMLEEPTEVQITSQLMFPLIHSKQYISEVTAALRNNHSVTKISLQLTQRIAEPSNNKELETYAKLGEAIGSMKQVDELELTVRLHNVALMSRAVASLIRNCKHIRKLKLDWGYGDAHRVPTWNDFCELAVSLQNVDLLEQITLDNVDEPSVFGHLCRVISTVSTRLTYIYCCGSAVLSLPDVKAVQLLLEGDSVEHVRLERFVIDSSEIYTTFLDTIRGAGVKGLCLSNMSLPRKGEDSLAQAVIASSIKEFRNEATLVGYGPEFLLAMGTHMPKSKTLEHLHFRESRAFKEANMPPIQSWERALEQLLIGSAASETLQSLQVQATPFYSASELTPARPLMRWTRDHEEASIHLLSQSKSLERFCIGGMFSKKMEESLSDNIVMAARRNYSIQEIELPHVDKPSILTCLGVLNRAGRCYLAYQGASSSSKANGVAVLARVSTSLDCIFIHLLEAPELFAR